MDEFEILRNNEDDDCNLRKQNYILLYKAKILL